MHGHNFHHFVPEYALALTQLWEQGMPNLLTVHEVWSEFICEDLLRRAKWDFVISFCQHVAKEIRKQAPAGIPERPTDSGNLSPHRLRGPRLVASTARGLIYTSSDSGIAWVPHQLDGIWRAAGVSVSISNEDDERLPCLCAPLVFTESGTFVFPELWRTGCRKQ